MIELKCSDCATVWPEDESAEDGCCPTCGGDSIWQRDLLAIAEKRLGVHRNQFGEVIPNLITDYPKELNL